MILNEKQRAALEAHGHPAAWFVCTTSQSAVIECDACDEILLILVDDPAVAQQEHPDAA